MQYKKGEYLIRDPHYMVNLFIVCNLQFPLCGVHMDMLIVYVEGVHDLICITPKYHTKINLFSLICQLWNWYIIYCGVQCSFLNYKLVVPLSSGIKKGHVYIAAKWLYLELR